MTALLDVTIKVSVIVLLAFTIVRLWRARSSAARHVVLASALACAAAVPLLGLVVPSWRIEWAAVSSAQMSAAADTRVSPMPIEASVHVSIPVSAPQPAIPTARITDIVIPIWLAGVAGSFFILLAGLARLAWMAAWAEGVERGRWPKIATEIAHEYGLSRPPRLLQSDHPALLVTWGLIRPKVLLPADAGAWTDDRVRVVLAHELAHVRRHDWLVQFSAEVLRSVYWFNPLLWIGCARLRQESEQACDDSVLRLGIGGTSYATHLLDLARAFRAHHRVWVPASAIARQSSLERRVIAMLNVQTDRRPVALRTAAAILVAFLGVTVSIAGLDAFAQARFATVNGTVVDQSGGVLVNATLAVTNVQTNARNEVLSNQTGFYELVGLPAGDYELEARFMGFTPLRTQLQVGVGETLHRNITLQIGAVQETITMTGSATASESATPRRAAPPARRPCPNPAVGGCIGPPIKVTHVRPIYPASLSEAGIEGVVLLQTLIGIDGNVKDLRVVSSPHPGLEQAALAAVAQWEFTPTTLNGSAIDTRMNVSVSFRLPETQAQP
jgi:TonB family protein